MPSNYCEEKDINKMIRSFQEENISNMGLSDSILDIKCPYCGDKIEKGSIRNVGLCLNTRNLGDISVQIFCFKCSLMETLYFKEEVKNVKEFFDYISGAEVLKSKPLTEGNMYSSGNNNTVDNMLIDMSEKKIMSNKLEQENNNDIV